MWNQPTDLELSKIPRLYATESTPLEEKIMHMHFFLGGCDWFVAEYSPDDRLFFGYAILNNDLQNAEWGYVSFDELIPLRTKESFEVDRDLHWKIRKASEIEQIQQAYNHQGKDI